MKTFYEQTFKRYQLSFQSLKTLLIISILGVISLTFTVRALAQASVSTDKLDYLPGETVTITATGFLGGESVTLRVVHTDVSGDNGSAAHQPWTVNADPGGNVSSTWLVPTDQDELWSILKLTADGGASSRHAEAIFADDQPNLDQAHNGGVGDPPISPVDWVHGDANDQNSHYQEGQSIPYRLVIPDADAGTTHTLILEWDIRDNGKSAIDYITSFQRIAETVDPLKDLSGTFDAPNFADIPAPTSNVTVGSFAQPFTSFNSLPAAERQMTVYNGSISSITYNAEGDPTAAHSSSSIKIEFTVSGTTGTKDVVFSWGGHLASRADWGAGNASSDIEGSPYHTRFIGIDDKGGNQDRSLKLKAVTFVPTCGVKGPNPVCPNTTNQDTAFTNAPTPTFQWTVTGGTVVGSTTDSIVKVIAPASGSYTASVKITDVSGGTTSSSTTCSITVNVKPKPTCSITGKANVCVNAKNVKYTAPTGASTYAWSITGNGTINGPTNGSSVLVNPTAVGYYTLTLTVSNGGCSCTCTKKVYVKAAPTCYINVPYPLPVGLSTGNSLCASTTGVIKTYNWSVKGTGWSITGGQGTSCITYTAGAAGTSGTFTLTVTNTSNCTSTCKVSFKATVYTISSQSTSPIAAQSPNSIRVNAYPNPYTNEVKFRFSSPVSGTATLETFDLRGKKLALIYQGRVEANIERSVSYNVPVNSRVPMMYKLTIGGKTFHGILLPIQ